MLSEHSFATSVESCPVQHPTKAHPPSMYSRYDWIYVDIRWNDEGAIVEFERRVVVEGMFEKYQCEDTGEGVWNYGMSVDDDDFDAETYQKRDNARAMGSCRRSSTHSLLQPP